MLPNLSQITSPYFFLKLVMLQCGIEPSWNMLPNIHHAGGPRGSWLRLAVLRRKKRVDADMMLSQNRKVRGHIVSLLLSNIEP